MRLFLSIPLAVATIAALGACGQSEESIRSTFRTGALQGCQRGDPAARAQMTQAGINIEQFCTCAIDRYMQSASLDQIRRDTENPNQSAALRTASMQCATEMMRQAGATPGAPAAPEANAPAPAAPAEFAAPAEENEAAAE